MADPHPKIRSDRGGHFRGGGNSDGPVILEQPPTGIAAPKMGLDESGLGWIQFLVQVRRDENARMFVRPRVHAVSPATHRRNASRARDRRERTVPRTTPTSPAISS